MIKTQKLDIISNKVGNKNLFQFVTKNFPKIQRGKMKDELASIKIN